MINKIPLFIILVIGIIITGITTADNLTLNNLSEYTIKSVNLPAGYQVVDNGTDFSLNGTCKSDFCLKKGYEIAYYNDSVYITHTIMEYSKPVTTDNLLKVFNETYPQVSTWVTDKLNSTKLNGNSIAYSYTIPAEMQPVGIMKGYVIILGNGDLYQTFETINGQYTDLLKFAEITLQKK